MELLIPGLILVALMVYASTRLKKYTAAAFEAETVEMDEFVVDKPDGFLHVINGDPKFAFESYSKEYGTGDASNIRKGTAKLRIRSGISLRDAAKQLTGTGKPAEDFNEVVDGHRYRMLVVKRDDGDAQRVISYKLSENGGRVFEFEVAALAEAAEQSWVSEFINGFRIK
ncbi:MAG: hypothetical protein AB7J13_10435 [Pyrinomonadaceae bacterium]